MKFRLLLALGLLASACGDSDSKGSGLKGDGDGDAAVDDTGDGGEMNPPEETVKLSLAEDLLYDFQVPGKAKVTEVMQLSGSELEAAVGAWGGGGYVVTAGADTSLGYTLVASRDKGAQRLFDTRVEQVTGSGLDASLEGMGSDGYVPTLVISNSVGYTIFGYRPRGSDQTLETRVEQVAGSALESMLENFGLQRYVLTAVVSNSAGYTLFGARYKDDDASFESRVDQVVGPSLATTLDNFGLSGFALTGSTSNSAGYTLFAQRIKNSTVKYATIVDQVVGPELADTVAAYGNAGFAVASMVSNSAGYTLVGIASEGTESPVAPPEPAKGSLTFGSEQEDVTTMDCVYTEAANMLIVTATAASGNFVELVFRELPFPGYFEVTWNADSSGKVELYAQRAGMTLLGRSGDVSYDEYDGDHFEVLGVLLSDGVTVSGDFTCDGLRVE